MPKYVTYEPTVKKLPSLLIIDFTAGKRNSAIDMTAKFFVDKTKTYILTKKKAPESAETISSLSVYFFDRLNGSLPYALLFVDDATQKKNIVFALRKLSSQNTKIVLLIPRRYTANFIDILLEAKSSPHVHIVLIGDIFGLSLPNTTLSKTIGRALTHYTVSVSAHSMVPIFPISDTDFLNLVSHMLFGNPYEHVVYKGYYGNPQTLLSLAHMLIRHEPELSIDFVKTDEQKVTSGVHFIHDRMIKDRLGVAPENLQGIYFGFNKSVLAMQEGIGSLYTKGSYTQKKSKTFSKHKIRRVGKRIFRCMLAGFLLYILCIVITFLLSAFLFKEGVLQLQNGKTQSALDTLTLSRSLHALTQKNIRVLLSVSAIPPLDTLRNYVDVYAELQENTLPTVHILANIGDEKKMSSNNLTSIESFIRDFYFFTQNQNTKNLRLIHDDDLHTISQYLPLMQVFKELGGYGQERSYLVLFQNSNELRPTGGFIGSVAYVKVKDGAVTSNQVQDVYDLDGQLKGHVEPHYIIRRNLQPNLYLRDSNFNPDFNISASTSAFLYTLESGKQVNGVIAIDTYVLKKLVEIAGPIRIPGKKDAFTPENVTSLIQDSIQNEFFPGSIEKKQILNVLMSKILVTIESDTQKQIALLKALPALVSEKHILFSFPNQSIQRAFQATGITGAMADNRAQNENIQDFISVNEANIGVNKANEFVTRTVTYSAFLHPDELLSDAALTIKNDDDNDYRAYIRFIVPEKAVLSGITINGQTQNIVPAVTDPAVFERAVFKLPSGLEVDQFTQNGTRMMGFIVNTPQKKQSRVHVLYKTPYKGFTKGTFTYSLLYVKQPGTLSYPLTVQLEADDRFKVTKSKNGPVQFNDNISADKEINVNVQRIKE